MTNRLALIPAFLFLFGCPPEDIEVRPVPVPEDRVERLDAGDYVLSVEQIHEITCDVVDPREVQGARMDLRVHFRGPQARVELEGLPMEGWMKDGVVRAFGSFDDVMVEEVDTEPVVDETDEGAGADEDGQASAESDGDSSAGAPPAGRDDRPVEAAPIHGQIELILDVDDAAHARGALNITYSEGCHLGLDVRIVPSEDKPVPVEEEEEEPPKAGESEPCGDEEDCG